MLGLKLNHVSKRGHRDCQSDTDVGYATDGGAVFMGIYIAWKMVTHPLIRCKLEFAEEFNSQVNQYYLFSYIDKENKIHII